MQTLKLRHGSAPNVRQRGGPSSGCKLSLSSSSDQFESDVQNVMGQLQQRLVQAEEEMKSVERENEKLKRYHNETRFDASTTHPSDESNNKEEPVSHSYTLISLFYFVSNIFHHCQYHTRSLT